MKTDTRRSFVKQLGLGVALASSAGKLSAAGANERVHLALIGCGQRGRAFHGRVSHICDPDETRLAETVEATGVSPANAVTDLRRILDDDAVDAVVIAAPDHWHAPAAILACQAGKHVYVEKPLSHNFRESQLLLQAAKQSGVVAQHGTQQRSSRFIRDAIQSLREGFIGDVLVAKAWNIQKRSNIGHEQPSDPPPGVDYDMWLGPAQYVPFQRNRFHKDWHWWHNFGTGDIGNDGTHDLDYARWGLGVETLPAHVSAIGGKYFFDDQQEFPDTATCIFEYPGDGAVGHKRKLIFEMRLWSRNYPMNCDSGAEFYGTDGQMFLSKRGKLRVIDSDNKVIVEKRREPEPGFAHLENFIESIKNNDTVNADLTKAHRTVALVHLANISLRMGRTLHFDPTNETILNDEEASRMLRRNYRDTGHWAIPDNV